MSPPPPVLTVRGTGVLLRYATCNFNSCCLVWWPLQTWRPNPPPNHPAACSNRSAMQCKYFSFFPSKLLKLLLLPSISLYYSAHFFGLTFYLLQYVSSKAYNNGQHFIVCGLMRIMLMAQHNKTFDSWNTSWKFPVTKFNVINRT